MASPVFSSSKEFKADPLLAQQPTAADLQRQYEAPAGVPGYADDRMSYRGVVNKSVGLGVVTLGLGAATYFYVSEQPSAMLFAFGAGLIAMVVGLIAAFKRTPGPGLVGTYAAAEGLFLGALTAAVEVAFDVPGAGAQALLATGITFMVCLWLYRSGKVRYTAKMQKIFMIGAISYLVFSLVNIGVMFFNPDMGAFGLRSATFSIGGFELPLGAIIGVVAVLLACISLIGDFDFIDNGVKRGLEKKLEWKAAFGLIVTLVWLYTEFLRLIAIFSGRD